MKLIGKIALGALALVALLVGYHIQCVRLAAGFARRENRHSSTWYRWFNEAPTLVLIATVILVVVKPLLK